MTNIVLLEREFYKTIEFPPYYICNCSFVNLRQYGLEIGNDVCYHTEDNITCEDCEQYKFNYSYPILCNYAYLYLASLITIDNNHNGNIEELKETILNTVIKRLKNNDDLKQEVKSFILMLYTNISPTDFLEY